jgi:hypothetical protein
MLLLQRALLKGIKECRKKLYPTADTHRDHDLDLLKTHVDHAVELLCDPCIPFEMTDDLRANVGLVRRALLQEKVEVEQPKTSRNGKRPKLNMDDDEENDLSYWESDDADLDELDVL